MKNRFLGSLKGAFYKKFTAFIVAAAMLCTAQPVYALAEKGGTGIWRGDAAGEAISCNTGEKTDADEGGLVDTGNNGNEDDYASVSENEADNNHTDGINEGEGNSKGGTGAENEGKDDNEDTASENSAGGDTVSDDGISENGISENGISENGISENAVISENEALSEEEEAAGANKLTADYYVTGGDYTYESGMDDSGDTKYESIFSGVYNDIRIERNGGRFFTGEEIVTLSGKDGATVTYKDGSDNSTDKNTVLSAENKKVSFEVHDIPVEFVHDKTVEISYSGDGGWTYENKSVNLNNDTLIRKLYAWEYAKEEDTGIYKRVSSQEISSENYSFNTPSENDISVSGNIVVNTGSLKAGKITDGNVIAIVAYLYDASQNDALFEKGDWAYGYGAAGAVDCDPVFFTLEKLEAEYGRYNKAYYSTDIYRKDQVGSFSIGHYTYRRDDKTNILTLYDCTSSPNYGFMNGYTSGWRSENLNDYLLDKWVIPATWTDPLTKKTYSVAIGPQSYYLDKNGNIGGYTGGRRFPIFAASLKISNGVKFPENCAYLFDTGHSKIEMMCLKSIVIEGSAAGVGSNITNMQGMFSGNWYGNRADQPVTILDKLDIAALNTSNVTNMSGMFYQQWVDGTGPDVSNFDTSKVTDFSQMFYNAKINNPVMTGWNTAKATDMSYMFGAQGVWSDFRNKPHTCPEGVFTSLDLSSFTFDNVTSMAGMFINQGQLSSLKFPANMNTSGVKDMSELFMSCYSLGDSALTEIYKLDTSGAVDMFGMFGAYHHRNWGSGDERVLSTENNKSYYQSCSDGTNDSNGGPAFTSLDFSKFTNFDTSKVQNMALMFDLPFATSISFSSKFNTAKVKDMNRMFRLPKVKDLDISTFLTPELTRASCMFDLAICTELNLGNGFNLSKIRQNYGSDGMFLCPKLATLDLSNVTFGSNEYALSGTSFIQWNSAYEGMIDGGSVNLTKICFPAKVPTLYEGAALPEDMYDEYGEEYLKYTGFPGGNENAVTLTTGSAPLTLVYGFFDNADNDKKVISKKTIYIDDQEEGTASVYLRLKMNPDEPKPMPSAEYELSAVRSSGESVEPGVIAIISDYGIAGIDLTAKREGYVDVTAKVRRSDGQVYTAKCRVVIEKSAHTLLTLKDADGNTFTCYENGDGTNTVTIKELTGKASGDKTTLKIGTLTGGGKTYTVTRIGNRAFFYTKSSVYFNNGYSGVSTPFTAVELNESVKVIGEYAFDPNNTSGSSVLSFVGPGVEEIGDYAFNDMVALKTVSLPKVKRLGRSVFSNTQNIESLTLNQSIESWNNGVLIYEFGKNQNLTEFTLPSCIKEIGCDGMPGGITSLVLPDTVEIIGESAFYNGSDYPNLASVTIPASVESIGASAFADKEKLTSVTFAENGSLTEIGDKAFYRCNALTSINFPDTVTSLGESVLEMYEGKLETVKLPANIAEIPDRAFYGCKLLTTVTSPTSFTRIGKEAFRDCEKLTFFTIPEGVTEIGVLAFSESGLTSIKFPDSLKEIPQGVCYQCESLTSVTLGNAVTTIGGEVYADTGGAVGGAFSMCKMLTSIKLPNTVRSIGQYTFDQSEKLAEINIPDGIEVLPYHVLAWTAITELTLPDSLTEIGEGAFKGCASLTKLYIPPSVEKIGAEAFYECKKLDEIGFPVGLKRIEYETCRLAGTVDAKAYIPDSVEYVGTRAFYNFGSSVENTSYDKGLIYWGGSEEKAKALEGDTTYATGYRGYSEIYGYDTNNPRLNSGWHITTTGIQYLSLSDNKPIKSKVTTVSGYGDDLYGFDSQGYRYENEAVVYGSKLYSFDEYGRGKEITGYTGSVTGIVGGNGVWVYLKDGMVQKAKATELFADNVITVNEEKYLLQSNGILGTGYYEDTSEYSASSNEAGITGWYFDEASAKLIWVKKTDSEGSVTYYGKDYTTTLNGIYPNEDGENVKYANGKCVMLTGLKLTDESDEEISSLTLYCGSDAGQENKPIQGTIRLVTLPEGLTLDPVPAITWSIINNNPKTRGETVIKEVSHTEGQIVISANAAGRAKVRVKAVATVENGASVTYTKDCLVISEGDEPETPVTPDPPAPTPPVVPGDEAAVTGVALNRYETELYPQETLKLSVVISPANAKDKSVTWKSDNEAVAVVDAAGKVTAIAAGKDSAGNDTEAAAVITVTTNDGKKTASCRVTVLPSEVLTEDTGGKTVEVDEDKPIWVGGLNESYVYTGEAIKPDIHVYKGQKLLREKTDYTVSYKNNKNVTPDGAAQNKQPSVTVKLKGDYTGSQVLYFKITPLTVSEDTVMMSKAKVSLSVKKFDYTGSAIEPEPVVTYKGNSLNKGTDYTVGYKNNTEIGTASVVVSGMGDYAGTKTVNFKITGKYTIPADGVTFKSGVNSEPYTYGGAKPEMTVKVNGRTLKKDVDYKVSYKNNKKLASADGASAPQVIIKGKGNYKTADNAGIIKNFAVVQRDLSDLVLTISDKAYSKKKNDFMKTTLLLSDEDFNDQKLKIGENKDYTAKFVTSDGSDTPAAGSTVQVTLTATGKNYTGTAAGGYRIIEAKSDINKAKVKINNGKACAYTGSGIEPGQENAPVLLVTMGSGKNLKTLTLGKDFEVLGYYNNINKGNKAYMVIRGINDYNGVKKVKFKITAKNAKDAFKGVYDKESGGFK